MKTLSKIIRTCFFGPIIFTQVDDFINVLWSEGFLNYDGGVVLAMISPAFIKV